MSFKLWYCDQTKTSRKGTTFNELQNIFIDKITAKQIYEPLACCKLSDEITDVKKILSEKGYDTLGVINDKNKVLGFIKFTELNTTNITNHINKFDTELLISDSTPISNLINILLKSEFVYVLNKNEINGIITRADINKPMVRIYLFGMISLFEMHLNYWINKLDENEWKEKLTIQRIKSAEEIFSQRKGENTELTLLECIQLCDKKTILLKDIKFLTTFNFSKSFFEKLLKNSEKIRNELAHSQNSIISNLDWPTFDETIQTIEIFLKNSEQKVSN